ncbi:hypothetical protein DEMA109039_12915 [Deinococcus marmoris]
MKVDAVAHQWGFIAAPRVAHLGQQHRLVGRGVGEGRDAVPAPHQRIAAPVIVLLREVDLWQLPQVRGAARGIAAADQVAVGVPGVQGRRHLADPGKQVTVADRRPVDLVPPFPGKQVGLGGVTGGDIAKAAFEEVFCLHVGHEFVRRLQRAAVGCVVGIVLPFSIDGGAELAVVDQHQLDVDAAPTGQRKHLIQQPRLFLPPAVIAQPGVLPLQPKGPGGHPHPRQIAAVAGEPGQPALVIGQDCRALTAGPADVEADGKVKLLRLSIIVGEVARVLLVKPHKARRVRSGHIEGQWRTPETGSGKSGAGRPFARRGRREAHPPACFSLRLQGGAVKILGPEGRDGHGFSGGRGEADVQIGLRRVIGIGKRAIGAEAELSRIERGWSAGGRGEAELRGRVARLRGSHRRERTSQGQQSALHACTLPTRAGANINRPPPLFRGFQSAGVQSAGTQSVGHLRRRSPAVRGRSAPPLLDSAPAPPADTAADHGCPF